MKSTLNYLATSLNMQTIGKVNFCKTKAELNQKNRHYMHAWTHKTKAELIQKNRHYMHAWTH